MAKAKRTRQWSRAFTPRGGKTVNLGVTGVPPTLRTKFAAKCKRTGQSQRNLLLGWIRNWIETDDPIKRDTAIATRPLPRPSLHTNHPSHRPRPALVIHG